MEKTYQTLLCSQQLYVSFGLSDERHTVYDEKHIYVNSNSHRRGFLAFFLLFLVFLAFVIQRVLKEQNFKKQSI